jgi:hypothetical protein
LCPHSRKLVPECHSRREAEYRFSRGFVPFPCPWPLVSLLGDSCGPVCTQVKCVVEATGQEHVERAMKHLKDKDYAIEML